MDQWKEAFWLSRHELKRSVPTYFLLFICLTFLLLFIVPTIGDYLENSTFGIDVFFILTFTTIVHWCRPKAFRNQESNSGLTVSRHLIMLNQLPIKKDTIIKHRLLSYIVISVPFHVIFLTLLYVLTPALRDSLPIGAYFAFSLFWICLSIYFGCTEPASEAGFYKFPVIVRNIIIAVIATFAILIIFHKILPLGLVHWMIVLSVKYPFIVSFFSILFAYLGLIYWIRNMHKKMNTMDYY